MSDKIPIGKYEWTVGPEHRRGGYIKIKFKEGVEDNIKNGDIITLDMIEPYESIAVRKVADYLLHNNYPEFSENNDWAIEDAKKIVDLVHEAEDADE